jgi:hypothetical protein
VTKRPAPTALARAEHTAAPLRLSKPDRDVLDEALRKGEDLREELETKTLEYGRWLLAKVFADDTVAALDDKTKNGIWQELVRRAGGPTLGISRHLLYVAVRIAAYDRRVTARAWRGLDVGRKELLLPLPRERVVEAARHVSELDLSQAKTREYVTVLMAQAGKPRQVRLTSKALAARVRKSHGALAGAAVLRRVRALRAEMPAEERAAFAADIERLRSALGDLLQAVRGR